MKSHNQNHSDWPAYDPAKTRREVEDAIEKSKDYQKLEFSGALTEGWEGDWRRCSPCQQGKRSRHEHSHTAC